MKEESQTQLAGLPTVLFSRDVHWTQEEIEPGEGVLIFLPPSYIGALAGAVVTGGKGRHLEGVLNPPHSKSSNQDSHLSTHPALLNPLEDYNTKTTYSQVNYLEISETNNQCSHKPRQVNVRRIKVPEHKNKHPGQPLSSAHR